MGGLIRQVIFHHPLAATIFTVAVVFGASMAVQYLATLRDAAISARLERFRVGEPEVRRYQR